MLAFVVTSASLLPFQLPDAQRGKSASPDYGALASNLARSVAVDHWINAEKPAIVESGLRKMKAAYRSAPDYSAIAGAMASAGLASMDMEELPAAFGERAEAGLRKMRAAYKSAPDYAKYSAAVAAAGVALTLTDPMAALPSFTPSEAFAMDPDALRCASGPSLWAKAREATPQYGALAAATAAIGRSKVDLASQEGAGLSF